MTKRRISRRDIFWQTVATGMVAWLCAWNIGQAAVVDRGTTVCEGAGDYVVLVHGVNWFRDTMKPIEDHLSALGYHTVHIHYVSRKVTPEEVAERMESAIAEHCSDPKRKIHFIGHSMGGIMIRNYLKQQEIENLGKTLLIATPNQGTELAETLQRSVKPLRKAFGETVEQLGTEGDSLPNTLGEPDFEPGVIMGSRSAFPFLSPLVPGTDDGVVAVEAGKLESMSDFLVTPTNHLTIVRHKEVLRQIAHFLEKGKFDSIPKEWQADSEHQQKRERPAAVAKRRLRRVRFGKGRR